MQNNFYSRETIWDKFTPVILIGLPSTQVVKGAIINSLHLYSKEFKSGLSLSNCGRLLVIDLSIEKDILKSLDNLKEILVDQLRSFDVNEQPTFYGEVKLTGNKTLYCYGFSNYVTDTKRKPSSTLHASAIKDSYELMPF
jgi:hypothetical protein